MLRWRRQHDADVAAGPSSPTVVCHFCSTRLALASSFGKGKAAQRLPVVPGSWSSFKCSVCQSWNLRNPSTGDFVQDARIYSDPSLNPPRTARPEGPFAAAPSSVFCSDCQTNQQLQLQLLAGYLPPDVSLQEEEQRLEHLEAYKASLDERYPVACEHCAEKVEHIIEERNLKAKARTVGGWLKRTTVEQIMNGSSGQQTNHVRIWRTKAVLWHLQNLATAGVCIHRALRNHLYFDLSARVPGHTVYQVAASKFLSISLVGLLWSFWDPTYLSRNQRQGDMHGQSRWLILQAMLLVSRILLSLSSVIGRPVPIAVWLSIGCAHIFPLLFKDRIIYATGPRRVRLVQRSLPASPQKPAFFYEAPRAPDRRPPAEGAQHNSVFGRSTFGSSTRNPSPVKQVLSNTKVAASQPTSMEWQPTHATSAAEHLPDIVDVDMLDVTDEYVSRSPLHLRPAIFNPSSENWHESSLGAIRGLERLFEQGVSLSDPTFAADQLTARQDTDSRSKPHLLYAGLGAVFAGSVAMYLRSARS